MATVKILYNDSAESLEKYLKSKEGKDAPQTEHSCFLDGLTKEFTQVQSQFNSKGNNALHLIQSWSPTESKTLSPEQIHEMGTEMANRFVPGHQFVVQTHTDQAHYHNHIVINPVHMETGKRIQNKLENVRTIRNINDALAKERGLSVLPPQESLRRHGPNETAKRIETYRGKSYIVDLTHKANFARNHATNYDEYLSILSGFNIQARIGNQNITYFYPGREVGKRGRNLDPRLDKPGLERKFARNRGAIEKSSELKGDLAKLVSAHRSPPSDHVGIVRPTGIDRHEKTLPLNDLISRRSDEITQPRKDQLQQSIIPIEEIQRAKTHSILKYCEKEKISIAEDASGKKVLKGREYIELSDYSWINHRNKTRGTVIDFVANHRSTGFLKAISILNDNPNLMLLEKYMSKSSRHYQSFYIPESESAPRTDAIRHIANFLEQKPPSKGFASLFKHQAVQVMPSGNILFFSEGNRNGYLEYYPSTATNSGITGNSGNFGKAGKRYEARKKGEIQAPFFNSRGQGQELYLFLDPKTLLKWNPDIFEKKNQSSQGVLGLLEPNLEIIHQTVASQKNLKRIKVIQDVNERNFPTTLEFFETLRESLNPFSIDTSLAWESITPSLPHTQTPERDWGPLLNR